MLAGILMILAGICLLYFIIIVLYAGITTSYVGIWLLFAAVLAAAGFFTARWQKDPEGAGLRLPVTLITLCAAGVVFFLILFIVIFGSVPAVAVPNLDYVIVLGAQVRPDGVSTTLRLRLDKAAEYAAQNPDTVLILSGGKGKNEREPEAVSMQTYLLAKGVPADRMLLEQQSASTVENIACSRLLIGKLRDEERARAGAGKSAQGLPENALPRGYEGMKIRKDLNNRDSAFERPLRLGILTSNFHLFRAQMIARRQGETSVTGIAAPSDPVLLAHMAFRDALAVLKDRLMGNL